MKAHLTLKLKVDSERYGLLTAQRKIQRGNMEIRFTDEYLGSSVFVYAYNEVSRGYSSFLYTEKSSSAKKKVRMAANEATMKIVIGRYSITCAKPADFRKIRNAMMKFRLISETGVGAWPSKKSARPGKKKPVPKRFKK